MSKVLDQLYDAWGHVGASLEQAKADAEKRKTEIDGRAKQVQSELSAATDPEEIERLRDEQEQIDQAWSALSNPPED